MAETIKYKGTWDKKFTKGDSFKARQFTGRTQYFDTPSTTLTDVRIKFKKGSKSGPEQKYIEVGAGITIDDASLWKFTISKFDFDWEVDKYYFDVETIDSDDNIDTNFSGIFTIVEEVTDESS